LEALRDDSLGQTEGLRPRGKGTGSALTSR
jgi:hypothetical protein